MSKFPFPQVLDSSIITTFKACPRQAWFSHIRRMQPSMVSIHLSAGTAWAKGMETARREYYEKGNSDYVIEGVRALWENYDPRCVVPDKHRAKGPEMLAEAFVRYFEVNAFETERLHPYKHHDTYAIEFTFAVPTPVLHPETGDPILYAGRCDMLGQFNDAVFVVDDKTTSSYGMNWQNNWRMRYQFHGYFWAAQQHGYPVSGVIVKGAYLSVSKFEFPESVLFIPQWRIDRWQEQMEKDIKAFVRAWETDDWEYDFSQACTSYGGCPVVEACDSKDHEVAIYQNSYQPNTWSPLVAIKELDLGKD